MSIFSPVYIKNPLLGADIYDKPIQASCLDHTTHEFNVLGCHISILAENRQL
jgi:hypothetical protein